VAEVTRLIIQAFGGVIQFLSGFVQFVLGFVTTIYDLFNGHFGKLRTDLQAIWNGIVDMFKGALNIINTITGGGACSACGLVWRQLPANHCFIERYVKERAKPFC
jgi:phage-related protein